MTSLLKIKIDNTKVTNKIEIQHFIYFFRKEKENYA